ncbi:hypothetical protein DB32_007010 [Sandaracinus amylolyticus]|uniref:Uncharacterized protein n=2 Tax=Sandaracinus amylolyticus TaxID=927083 RepID=A0A0F6W864_9BACT|nr:hypothetical protein DB32_007010 [Sandaracinus amylolyticus]
MGGGDYVTEMGVEPRISNAPRRPSPPRDEGEKKQARDVASEARREERIDRILADSFPASDPPPWTTTGGRR